jgi:hypothetical protein
MTPRGLLALATLMFAAVPALPAGAQESRAAMLARQRQEKAGPLQPYRPGRLERALLFVERREHIRWHRLAGDEQQVTSLRAQAPVELLAGGHPFVSARIRAYHPDRPAWATPLDVYFRRTAGGWALVGLDRDP